MILFIKSILLLLVACFPSASLAAKSKNHVTLYKPNIRESKTHQTNDLFKSYLELSSFRHKTLAQNVANINTPGYKADEVAMPSDYGDLSMGKTTRKISMSKTSGRHINGSKGSRGRFSSHKLKDPYEIKKNGNNVSMNQQMTKISQNRNEYNAAVKGYATLNSLYGAVIGK